ncbi:MAG: ABC transporter permease subunit, partial [Thermomicrobiales bacterium]
RQLISRWDLVIIPAVLSGLLLLTVAFRGASSTFDASTPDLTVSLDASHLPYYALRSMLRMFLAVALSLIFTFTYATIAAKSKRGEKVLIPILDFLQSLPILGFLTVTTAIFLGVYRGSLLGLEMASVFAIFTSQVWNMAFSFYHSLRTTPNELNEAASVLRLSPWRKFWQLEVPFALPGLIWNTMMAVSGGWFFVVASEVITVIGRDNAQQLPGLGSYIAQAISQTNTHAMILAGLTLLLLVLIYDQLIFRPIVAWAEKFKLELLESQDVASSWVLTGLRRARLAQRVASWPGAIISRLPVLPHRQNRPGERVESPSIIRTGKRPIDRVIDVALVTATLILIALFAHFLFGPSLGFGDGEIERANANLNARLDPATAARFEQAGVKTGGDQTVYLSNVCAISDNGANISSSLAQALATGGVENPHSLTSACAQPMVDAGNVSPREFGEVAKLGLFTMSRVIVMIVLASLFWVPIGVWIGSRP